MEWIHPQTKTIREEMVEMVGGKGIPSKKENP